MSAVGGPALRPCGSCPYRRDVPSGVWAEEEYRKLAAYDAPTWGQPPRLFLCHSAPDRVCAGWCGTHDMAESLGLRLALSDGSMAPADVEACLDYVSPVPLFASGTEAAAHGVADIPAPSPAAERVMAKVERRRASGAGLPGGVLAPPLGEVGLAPQRGAADVGGLGESGEALGVVVDRPSGDPEKVGCLLRVDPAAHVHTEYGKTYALSANRGGCLLPVSAFAEQPKASNT